MNSLYYQKRLSRNIGDKFFTSLSIICALIAILPLIFLVTYILIKGGSQITPELFTLEPNPPGDDLDAGGINPALIGTLIITTIASIIAIPVGVGGGIYLAEYSKGGAFSRFIRFGVNVLAGVPSIIAGVFIYALIVSTKILFGSMYSGLAGGMRMMESLISLSQMTRTTLAINELKSKNLPYIVVLTDPTAGGITASYAMLGDLEIAESDHCLIAFAGARVIQGTVKEDLPEGFQKSSYVKKTGFVDLIVDRKDLTRKIGTLLSILLNKNSDISTEQDENTGNTQSLSKIA